MVEKADVESLIQQALDQFEQVPLAASLRRAIRIARLRSDLPAIWWLSMEHGSPDDHQEVRAELAPHFDRDDFGRRHEYLVERWIRERRTRPVDLDGTMGKEMVDSSSIEELEGKIEYLRRIEADERSLGNLDMATWAHGTRGQLQPILDNIRSRIYDFLVRTEGQVRAGVHPDVITRTRKLVFDSLRGVAPGAADQIREAETALAARTSERYSHSVLSCRRALKSLADALYPSSAEPVAGSNGVERELSDAQYVSRLWQFAYEEAGGHRSGDLTLAAIQDLGRRVDAVYDAASKGVHDIVDEGEAHQIVTQTIMLCGDLLRIRSRTSAIDVDLSNNLPNTELPTRPSD